MIKHERWKRGKPLINFIKGLEYAVPTVLETDAAIERIMVKSKRSPFVQMAAGLSPSQIDAFITRWNSDNQILGKQKS